MTVSKNPFTSTHTFGRRAALAALASLGGAAVLSACSTTAAAPKSSSAAASASSAGGFPVSIKHSLGTTEVKAAPQRIATISTNNIDFVLAFDVVPVGSAAVSWGQNSNNSTPWVDAKLQELGAMWGSDKAPKQYSEADGINFAEIAALQPDLIVGVYSGLTQEDYDKLAKIAPTLAFPGEAWGTSWQEGTKMVGQALGQTAKADALIAEVTKGFEAEVAKIPSIAGKTYVNGYLTPAKADGIGLYAESDPRPRFLRDMGMQPSPAIKDIVAGKAWVDYSAEKAASLESDLMVAWVNDAADIPTILADPLLSQIPAIKAGHYVFDADKTRVLGVTSASPLSIPHVAPGYIAMIGKALTT